MGKGHLFVWRDVYQQLGATSTCPYCATATTLYSMVYTQWEDGFDRREEDYTCPLCGWRAEYVFADLCTASWSAIRGFDISDTRVAMDELGTYLARNYEDIYQLDPFRFEELVADVFKDHQREAVVTSKSRDGGVDIFLLNRQAGSIDAVIECKRYAKDRKVGIGVVQRLAGVAMQWQARKAILVTTSCLSLDARRSGQAIVERNEIEMEFVAAQELLILLGAYNAALPPLDKLTPEIRMQIIESNTSKKGSKHG